MKLHPPETVAAYTEAGWWGVKTWPEMLADHVTAMPDRLAVADAPNLASINGSSVQRLTWRELAARVDQVAAALHAGGVRSGDRVGLQLPNSVDLTASYLALASLGAIAVPFALQYGEFELVQMGELAGMTAFVASSLPRRPLEPLARVLTDRLPLRSVFAVGPDVPEGVLPLGVSADVSPEHVSAAHRYRETLDFDPNDAVTLCWTSGTESIPKGVPRCANDWYRMGLSGVDGADLTVDDVLLNSFPMVNMGGIAGMFIPWLITGATLIQHHPFDASVYFRQIQDEAVTYTLAAPAVLIRSLSMPEVTVQGLASVRAIGSGSAPLPPSMIVAWRERFGVDIINCFGSNEGITLNCDPRSVPDPEQRSRLFPRFGSPDHVWRHRSALGMESRLVSQEDGAIITDPLVPGELCIKGPGVFAGYYQGTTSSDPFDEDGFYRTGDIFQYVTDEHGDMRFFQYVDRAKDLIIRGGLKISPAELEQLIQGQPAVREVAVVGRPDLELGERVEAVVVLNPGAALSLAELLAFLREHQLAVFKLPESLRIVAELPRSPMGKVLKRSLRATS